MKIEEMEQMKPIQPVLRPRRRCALCHLMGHDAVKCLRNRQLAGLSMNVSEDSVSSLLGPMLEKKKKIVWSSTHPKLPEDQGLRRVRRGRPPNAVAAAQRDFEREQRDHKRDQRDQRARASDVVDVDVDISAEESESEEISQLPSEWARAGNTIFKHTRKKHPPSSWKAATLKAKQDKINADLLSETKEKVEPPPLPSTGLPQPYFDYTAEEAAMAFPLLKKGIDPAYLVTEKGLHPRSVRGIILEYENLTGCMILFKPVVDKINKLALAGTFPIPNGESLYDVMLQASEDHKCNLCDKRQHSENCSICEKARILRNISVRKLSLAGLEEEKAEAEAALFEDEASS